MNSRVFVHTNVHDIRLRIIRADGPLYGAMMPRCSDGTFDARRRVHRTRSMFLELLKYTGARLRRNVCDVRFVHRYSNQWRWLQRPGLCWVRLLTLDTRKPRNGHFNHREYGLACVAVQHKHEGKLTHLNNHIPLTFVGSNRHQHGCRRKVVVPDVVVNQLIMPFPFTGRRIQCQHAIGKKVCAFSGTAINEFTCSGSGCREYPTAFLINRQSTPGIGGAVDHILLPLPCIISVLTWERNRVEYPLELSGQCIICPYVARRTGVAFRLTAGYDEVMLVYNTLCCDLNVDLFLRDRKVLS